MYIHIYVYAYIHTYICIHILTHMYIKADLIATHAHEFIVGLLGRDGH